MWKIDANRNDLIGNFPVELGKVGASKGSWVQDYDFFCTQYKIIKCPYVSQVQTEVGQAVRFANCAIDISNWRATLLAISVTGSSITELILHNTQINAQHLSDFIAAIDAIGYFRSFRLEFSTFGEETVASISESIRNLLSGTCNVEYISLRGCRLGDEVLAAAASSIASNVVLQSLNISDNGLTDTSCVDLAKALRLNPFIGSLSVSRNALTSLSLEALLRLGSGTESSPDDAPFLKKLTGTLNDKNKALKNLNKKRKKGGEEEFPECPPLPDRAATVDGKAGVANKTLRCIDISWNPISTNDFLAVIEASCGPVGTSAVTPLSLVALGLGIDEGTQQRLSSNYSGTLVVSV